MTRPDHSQSHAGRFRCCWSAVSCCLWCSERGGGLNVVLVRLDGDLLGDLGLRLEHGDELLALGGVLRALPGLVVDNVGQPHHDVARHGRGGPGGLDDGAEPVRRGA